MSKKWYNYIVSVDDAAGTEPNPPNARPMPEALRPAPRVRLRAWPRSHPA